MKFEGSFEGSQIIFIISKRNIYICVIGLRLLRGKIWVLLLSEINMSKYYLFIVEKKKRNFFKNKYKGKFFNYLVITEF